MTDALRANASAVAATAVALIAGCHRVHPDAAPIIGEATFKLSPYVPHVQTADGADSLTSDVCTLVQRR